MTREGFEAFDTRKIDEYARQAKATWETTDAYNEYEQKSKNWTKADRAGGEGTAQFACDAIELYCG